MSYKYFLSIGAVFKNEGHILIEWLEHYKFHGVDHIYLINDESSDNFLEILQPYITEGYVTLFNNEIPKSETTDRQSKIYKRYLTECIKDCEWMAILDLDEFLWSPDSVNLQPIIKKYENYGTISMFWTCFGDSGYVKQPKLAVDSFVKCMSRESKELWNWKGPKTIINTKFFNGEFSVHVQGSTKRGIDVYELEINHYNIQSFEFHMNIKTTRGSADHTSIFTTQTFISNNLLFNELIDERLKIQNQPINEIIERKYVPPKFVLSIKELEYKYCNLAIIVVGGNKISKEKEQSIASLCNSENYDIIDFNVTINNNVFQTNMNDFVNSLLKTYFKVFLVEAGDDFKGTIHPVKYYYNRDSVWGDIKSIIPWSRPYIISELCKNDYKGINTLGYVKNMKNPVGYSDSIKNSREGGIYVKTDEVSNVFLSHKALDWMYKYPHFNVVY